MLEAPPETRSTWKADTIVEPDVLASGPTSVAFRAVDSGEISDAKTC
jgi:hypothetical protein